MRPTVKLSTLTAFTAAVVMLTPGISHADADTALQNVRTKKCLEIENSSGSNGARAQQWSCNGQAGARWEFEDVGGGYFQLVNDSGKCLEVADSRTDNGAPVQQWSCHDIATQYWERRSVLGKGGWVFLNKNSGLSLEIENSAGWNGARAQQWSYEGSGGQMWDMGRP